MFISKAQELRKANVGLHAQMAVLVKKADDEKRAMTAEESTSFDKMDGEFEARVLDIAKHEKVEKREVELAKLDPRKAGRDGPADGAEAAEKDLQRRAFRAFISQQPDEWDEETRQIVAASQALVPKEARALGRGMVLAGRRDLEARALTAAANATVAEEFMRELDVALKSYAGIAQAARIVNTTTGADMPWPTMNDTANAGHLLAEGSAAATNVDPTLGAVTFQAFLYTSDIVLVPNQLIQDSAFPVESFLAEALGARLGRIMNTHGTTGDGASKPRGIVTALMADTTPVVPASATALAYNDLVKLEHSVDPAYRARPKVAWMMHDLILAALKKIVDSNGRPLFMPANETPGTPGTILGKPYFINQAMDSTIAEDKETLLYGDFSKYVIRRTLNPILVRLNERYAEYFQTGFVMFERWDSDLVDGAATPIAVLTHNLA